MCIRDRTNLAVLEKGCENLDKHIENVRDKFGLPVVVAINRFPTDDVEELEFLKKHCDDLGVRAAISEVVGRGGDGGFELAKEVLDSLEHEKPDFRFLYELDSPVKDKIEKLAKEIYGAKGVIYSGSAERDIRTIEKQGLGGLPICTAKTQLSLTDDPALRGAPTDWELNVREVRISAGAGFCLLYTSRCV